MRLIAARLALEAPTVSSVLIIVATHKAFMAGPRLNQRAIHTEVLAREPLLVLGDAHNLVKEFDDRVVFDQPLAVLGEDGGYPNGIVHRQPDKPTKQQVILNLLHQLALGAHAIEHLQQHRAQQLLWRNAGPPT